MVKCRHLKGLSQPSYAATLEREEAINKDRDLF